MAFTQNWDGSFKGVPAASEDIRLGASRITEFRQAVEERMEVDHLWLNQPDDGGMHDKVTLATIKGAAPTAGSGHAVVYIKTVSGAEELFFVNDDATETQLTDFVSKASGGTFAGAVILGSTLAVTGTTTLTDLLTANAGAHLANAQWLNSRDNGDSVDIDLIQVDASDDIQIGDVLNDVVINALTLKHGANTIPGVVASDVSAFTDPAAGEDNTIWRYKQWADGTVEQWGMHKHSGSGLETSAVFPITMANALYNVTIGATSANPHRWETRTTTTIDLDNNGGSDEYTGVHIFGTHA